MPRIEIDNKINIPQLLGIMGVGVALIAYIVRIESAQAALQQAYIAADMLIDMSSVERDMRLSDKCESNQENIKRMFDSIDGRLKRIESKI